jgi:hypothetical protein
MKRLITAALCGFFIAGCSVLGQKESIDSAGVTDVEIKFCPVGPRDAPTEFQPCNIHWLDGKEKANVALSIDVPGYGKLMYTADQVKAFQGQEAIAKLTEELGKAGIAGASDIAKTVVKALNPVAVP